nr:MAG TPA: hypothetical protein [Caudoviricetes sp.]
MAARIRSSVSTASTTGRGAASARSRISWARRMMSTGVIPKAVASCSNCVTLISRSAPRIRISELTGTPDTAES